MKPPSQAHHGALEIVLMDGNGTRNVIITIKITSVAIVVFVIAPSNGCPRVFAKVLFIPAWTGPPQPIIKAIKK